MFALVSRASPTLYRGERSLRAISESDLEEAKRRREAEEAKEEEEEEEEAEEEEEEEAKEEEEAGEEEAERRANVLRSFNQTGPT